MNAAIDQQCELYIANNELEADVAEKIKQIYIEKEDRPLSKAIASGKQWFRSNTFRWL
jgi:hypothetical protein